MTSLSLFTILSIFIILIILSIIAVFSGYSFYKLVQVIKVLNKTQTFAMNQAKLFNEFLDVYAKNSKRVDTYLGMLDKDSTKNVELIAEMAEIVNTHTLLLQPSKGLIDV